jgi:GTPase SAR1 family protein
MESVEGRRNSLSETSATFKVLLIGDSGTGKSSFLLRFTDDVWLPPDQVNATIGVDFKVKSIIIDEKKYKLTIWVWCCLFPLTSTFIFLRIPQDRNGLEH